MEFTGRVLVHMIGPKKYLLSKKNLVKASSQIKEVRKNLDNGASPKNRTILCLWSWKTSETGVCVAVIKENSKELAQSIAVGQENSGHLNHSAA